MRATLAATIMSACFACSVSAQSTPPSPKPTPDSRSLAPDTQVCPPDTRSGSTSGSGGDQNLSDRLAESKGVICPPAVADPEIALPPPQGGRTPVIPPPGSPGGDQSVQPK